MEVTADISFYPLCDQYFEIIEQFLEDIHSQEKLKIETNDVSTIITGEYTLVFNLIKKKLRPFLESEDAVFVIKISNACGKKK